VEGGCGRQGCEVEGQRWARLRGPAARKREVALHQNPSTEQGLLGPHCDVCSVLPALWHSLEESGERERCETTVPSKESRSTTGERPRTAAAPAQSTGPRAPARPSARHRPHSTRSRTEGQRAAKSSHVESPGLTPRMLADLILHRRVRSEAAAGGKSRVGRHAAVTLATGLVRARRPLEALDLAALPPCRRSLHLHHLQRGCASGRSSLPQVPSSRSSSRSPSSPSAASSTLTPTRRPSSAPTRPRAAFRSGRAFVAPNPLKPAPSKLAEPVLLIPFDTSQADCQGLALWLVPDRVESAPVVDPPLARRRPLARRPPLGRCA
jgi:hypothetical protein